MAAPTPEDRPRIIATTDGEVDDRCSMNRFLLYTNEWDVEGLIYSSSKHHWKGHTWSGTEWIEEQIDAYADVYDTLQNHADGYPSPDTVRSRIAVGNIDGVGEMDADTAGSERIVEVLLQDKPGPVYLQAWGGTNTIARALWHIQEHHPDRMDEVSEKAIIYIIGNQDTTLREYIQPNWPELEVLLSARQFAVLAYSWADRMPSRVGSYFGDGWMLEHILEEHGQLCSAYPQDKPSWRPDAGHFISEGDTPSFLHQIPVGLGSLEDPTYGGWGGRFSLENGSRNVWTGSATDGDIFKPIWRWAPAFQRDWAARADWCVATYAEANHPPDVVVDEEPGRAIVYRSAAAGEQVVLDASGTTDPDGDLLDFRWWYYPEPSSYRGEITITRDRSERATVAVPSDAAGESIHVILTVTDFGKPNLSRYRRVIIDVE